MSHNSVTIVGKVLSWCHPVEVTFKGVMPVGLTSLRRWSVRLTPVRRLSVGVMPNGAMICCDNGPFGWCLIGPYILTYTCFKARTLSHQSLLQQTITPLGISLAIAALGIASMDHRLIKHHLNGICPTGIAQSDVASAGLNHFVKLLKGRLWRWPFPWFQYENYDAY